MFLLLNKDYIIVLNFFIYLLSINFSTFCWKHITLNFLRWTVCYLCLKSEQSVEYSTSRNFFGRFWCSFYFISVAASVWNYCSVL